MTTYSNTFYSPKYNDSKQVIETTAKPVEYNGHLIYHRIRSNSKGGDVFDIVKNGACIGMYAGINGAKRRIDQFN